MNVSDDSSTTPNPLSPNNFTNNDIWKVQLQTGLNVIYAINAILGIPANIYVIWLIFTGKGSGLVFDFVSLNLTLSDLLYCFSSVTFILCSQCTQLSMFSFYFEALPCTGRPLFFCLICMERYLAVVHPVTFLKFKPLRYRIMCSAAVWMITLASGEFYISVISSENTYLYICVALPLYFLLLSFKIFCCLAVFRSLKHPGPGQKGKDGERANHVKRKAINVILITIVGVIIQYIPLFTAGFLYGVLSVSQFEIIWSTAFAVSIFSGYVHPLLYIHRVRKN